MRGLATAIFLERLEKELKVPLHEKFDVFSGTSIGSAIAAGLQHKKMTMSKITEMFSHKNICKIFDKSCADNFLDVVQLYPKYTGTGKQAVISEALGSMPIYNSNSPSLLVVPVYDLRNRDIYLFNSARDSIPVDILVGAATSATAYFPYRDIVIDRTKKNGIQDARKMSPVDAGINNNNPTACAVAYTRKYMGTDRPIKILSVGTGTFKEPILGMENAGGVQWAPYVLSVTMDQSSVHKNMKYEFGDQSYLRVNSHLPKDIDLDDTTREGRQKLIDLGNTWWETYGEAALRLLNQ